MPESRSDPTIHTGRLARLGDLAYRRRGRMILAWIVLLVATIAIAPRVAGEFDADFTTPGSDSEAAQQILRESFGGQTGDAVDVVWQARAGAESPSAAPRVDRFLERAEGLEGIGEIGRRQYSRDGTIGLVRLELDRQAIDVPTVTGRQLIDLAAETSGEGLRIELGGFAIENAEEGTSPEFAGLIAAAVILLVAFGSVVAAGLPLLTAIFGLGISAPLIGVVAAGIDVPDFAPAVAGLIGIGVGVDYALLVLTRFRSALDAGADRRAAVVEAVSTAGRSVLVAGVTVVIALLGLFLVGVTFLRGIAVSASLAVLVVMAASVTLLPALLALLGPRVDRLRIPGLGRARRTGGTTLSARWSRAVQRRPWPAALAGAAVLMALTAPVLGIQLGFPDAGNDRAETTTRQAYDLIAEGFGPGANGPLLLAAKLDGAGGIGKLEQLNGRLQAESGVASVSRPRLSPRGDAAALTVIPTTAPQDDATSDLVRRLRHDVLPQALSGSGLTVLVGGPTAALVDQSELVAGRLPVFIAAVVGLSFLLLLAAFRSPLIALKAGVMNLLSVGAAYGVLALVAEGGWAGQLIGVDSNTPIPPFIPVMMFAILFGLSMDYEVFLLSRVREEYLRTSHTGTAVAEGVAKTARVITAAAAIMVGVFLAFVFSPEVFLKLMGVGMATAILVDATVVRMVLVPAVMQLMGRANWWIPRWLDRALPRFDVEPPPQPVAVEGR
jgi:RND superfamily putative drug exporter